MAEDNPWKKQMQANRNKADGKPDTARSNEANTPPAQPPWMKNNNATSSPSAPNWAKPNTPVDTPSSPVVSQPPWAKSNSTTASTPTVAQPPWAKTSSPVVTTPVPATGTVSPPPWAKPATSAVTNPPPPSPAPWAKPSPAVTATTETTAPPWSKPATSSVSAPAWSKPSSPAPQGNDWKLKQNAEIERQKKELEEKIRQQQEEEREKKRVEREKREREKEAQDAARENEEMGREDELSSRREQYDREEQERKEREKREEEERLKREEEERLRKEEEARIQKEREEREARERERAEQEKRQAQSERERERQREKQRERQQQQRQAEASKKKGKSSRRQKRQNMQNSKISHISSIKGLNQINLQDRDTSYPENLFHRYLRLINEESRQADYKCKIEIQRVILQAQLEFQREAEGELVSLMEKRKVTPRKRRVVFSNTMEIQYALCEGRKAEGSLAFATEEVDDLRTRFQQYELLTRAIQTLLRRKLTMHLRAPLLALGEYKGVTFLIESICPELADIIETEVDLFQEITNEVLILEKELEMAHDSRSGLRPITKNQLLAKKINVYGEDYFVLYIRSDPKQAPSPKKDKQPHPEQFSDMRFLQSFATHSSLLPLYCPPPVVSKATQEYCEKMGAAPQKQVIKQLTLARAILTVYSSCQGEVNEESFFQLLLDGNKQIWDMINSAGSADREVPTPAVLAYLQQQSGIRFHFGPHLYARKRSQEIVKSVKPVVFLQRLELQLLEFLRNMERYIAEDRQELVEQAVQMSRAIWAEIDRGQGSFNFLRVQQEVAYLMYRHRQAEAIQLLDNASQNLVPMAAEHIPIALLYLKLYVATDAQIPLLRKLSHLLQVLGFYFKEETITHASVYTVVGSYYSRKRGEEAEEREKKVVKFYEHALSIALQLYGEKAQEVAEIYLSRATAFSHLGQYDLFHKDIQQAIKIYKAHSKNAMRIAECCQMLGRVKCLEGKQEEGVDIMESSSLTFLKLQNYVQALRTSFEAIPFLESQEGQLEAKLEKIIDISFTYKCVWAFRKAVAYILTRELTCYTALGEPQLRQLFPHDPQDDRSNEEVLIDLEEEIRGFTSFIEIVRWSLSMLAGRLASRRQAGSDYEKAYSVMREVLRFYWPEEGERRMEGEGELTKQAESRLL